MTPDFTPMMRLVALQTRFAVETSQMMMKLAMMPWSNLPAGYGSVCAPFGATTAKTAEAPVEAAPVDAPVETAAVETAEAAETVTETVADAAEDVAETTVETTAETAEDVAETTAETTEAFTEETTEAAEEIAETVTEEPALMTAPEGDADDLTLLNGVGPKLAEALNEAGIYHYRQIAAWTEANVAWVDENVSGVRGRASRNGWVAQAAELAN
ncbi:hypothetical protein AVJ23_19360 [Pseudoponticoccus marisrubri]|uniref:Uncharacterized protein n=2 Tax=Pseudoponticoccus marisrubri TaxID=1685382 RepID=A0A0W7WF32_9RHOB|nr:hypothetical protein AVJ23_19360 [Pseudoponticoccus marisrubri]